MVKNNGDDNDCESAAGKKNHRGDNNDDDDDDQSTHSSNNSRRRRGDAPRGDRSPAAGASGRSGGHSKTANSTKRLMESPVSAADTTSTCSLSTAASPGTSSTLGGFGSGSVGGAAIVGGGIAVGAGGGALATAETGSGGQQLPSRKLTRQERRLLRRQRRQERQRQRQTPEAVMRQLQTMATTLGISFGLFLLFFLNLPALVFLISTTALAALTATIAYQYLLLQYNAVLETGGIVNLLPESVQSSIRDALQGTTLHEWMTDPAFFMEYRYLMLYFIPGLDQAQLDALVDRLPERHRNVLRQPGYMSSMTPTSLRRVLVNDEGGNNANENALVPVGSNDAPPDGPRRQLFANSQRNASSRESNGVSSDNNGIAYEPSTSQLWADITATVTGVLQGSAATQGTLDAIEEEDYASDDVSSSSASVESGVVIDETNERDDEQRPAIPPTVTVDDTSVASPESMRQQQQRAPAPRTPQLTQTAEEEQQVEGDILYDALAAMTNNYISSATEAATNSIRDVAVDTVEYLTPGIVRLGIGTSFLSGLGLLGGYYMNFVHGHPMGWRRPIPRLIGGSSAPSGGNSEREAMTTTARYVTYGLMSTAFGGAASAGFMLLIRSGVRMSFAAQRESSPGSEKKDKKRID